MIWKKGCLHATHPIPFAELLLVLQVSLASNSGVGPFARLRAGASIDSGAYVGNFCELKGAHVGQGGNVCHLSYLGDADVGDRANIGAGTITCNYSNFSAHMSVAMQIFKSIGKSLNSESALLFCSSAGTHQCISKY